MRWRHPKWGLCVAVLVVFVWNVFLIKSRIYYSAFWKIGKPSTNHFTTLTSLNVSIRENPQNSSSESVIHSSNFLATTETIPHFLQSNETIPSLKEADV